MKNAFHTISLVRQLNLSPDNRNQPRRTSGSKLLSTCRVLALAALALLCGRPAAVFAQVVPRGYVQLYPDGASMTQGQTVQFRAAVMNPLGFELPNRQVTWKSGNAAIATVTDTGLVRAVAPGAVTITAKSGAALGTTTVIVSGAPLNTPPVVTITAPADGATFQTSTPITFTAAATDLQQGNVSNLIVWSAAPAADPNGAQTQLGTGASLVTSSLAAGSYLITASATDTGHLTGVAQVGITVQPPCSQHADLQPAEGLKIPQLLQLWALGSSDSCGRPIQYFWYCLSDTSTECPNFLAQANTPGNTNATPVLNLQEFDIIGIGLQVCVTGTNECSPSAPWRHDLGWNIYEGAPVDLGPYNLPTYSKRSPADRKR
jgi:hypothetical protein